MQVTTETSGTEAVSLDSNGVELGAELVLPRDAEGVVIVTSGNGSSRLSERCQYLARALRDGRLGTLILDLIAVEERSGDRASPTITFDLALLAERLVAATDWLTKHPVAGSLRLGYLAAGTGAAAALLAARDRPDDVSAIVSRGGRPDLGGEALREVRAPTMLVVGECDNALVGLNRLAYERLGCEKRLFEVPGATHLFEEEGTLEIVARHSRAWLREHVPLRKAS